MKIRPLAIVALFTLVACNRQKAAQRYLAEEGFTDVVLTKSGGGFDFTAKNATGQHCTGTVTVAMGERDHTSICDDVCTAAEWKACFALGQRSDKTNPAQAVTYYVTGCDAGDAACCVNAGVAYDKGNGVAKDVDKSFVYDKKGCDGGDGQGCLNVAIDYDLALGTAKDLAAAYRAAEIACTKKIMNGCKMAGQALVNAKGIPRDVITGLDRLDRACSSNESYGACTSLGVYYIEGRAGITKDVPRGEKALLTACGKNEPTACFDLGHYGMEKKIKLPDVEIVDYLTKACDKGEGGGCNELGVMMERGQAGYTKDLAGALAQYDKGCSKDDDTSCRNAGVFYEAGRGAPKDLAKAAAAYDKCCAAGNDECCTKRKALPP